MLAKSTFVFEQTNPKLSKDEPGSGIVRNAADVMAYSAAWIKYATKASFALDPSALDKGTSGLQAAYAMLNHLSPSAGQMAIALQRKSHVYFDCDTKEIHLPAPETCKLCIEFVKYLRCDQRSKTQCFVDWLRTFRSELNVPKLYQRQRGFGCAVAVLYASRFSDFYCGQWLCAWIPWDTDVRLPESCDRVPPSYKYFQACRVLRPEHWRCLNPIRTELEIEGHKADFIDAVLSRFQSANEICDLILSNKLDWKDPVAMPISETLIPEQKGRS